jgi:RNA polymerase sigma factor (sigma-70 family)
VSELAASDSFRDLLQEVEAGSEDAIRKLLASHGEVVLRVVRARMNRVLRSQYDSEDFVQAVWASFFKYRDLIGRFETIDDLAAFLRSMAANKVMQECRRRLKSQRFDRRRERAAESWGLRSLDQFRTADPTPSAVASAAEEFSRLSEVEQKLAQLRAAGSTHEEIAAALGIHPSTVRRILRKIQARETAE